MEGSLLSTKPFLKEIPPSTLVATNNIPNLIELEGYGTESDLGSVHETGKHCVGLIFYDCDESLSMKRSRGVCLTLRASDIGIKPSRAP